MSEDITSWSYGSFLESTFMNVMNVVNIVARECCNQSKEKSQYIYKKSECRHVG